MPGWNAQKNPLSDDKTSVSAPINDAAYKAPSARMPVSANALGQKPTYTQTAWTAQKPAGLTLTPVKASSPLLPAEKPAISGSDNLAIAP